MLLIDQQDNPTYKRYFTAYESYKHRFSESLNTTKSYLNSFGIRINNQSSSNNTCLNSDYIVNLLNSSSQQIFMMHSDLYHVITVYPKDVMLLYAICQVYHCQIFHCSTRSRPIIICLNNKAPCSDFSRSPLQHTDSYLQQTKWLSLRLDVHFMQNLAQEKSAEDEGCRIWAYFCI
jgi:hypothetical protein